MAVIQWYWEDVSLQFCFLLLWCNCGVLSPLFASIQSQLCAARTLISTHVYPRVLVLHSAVNIVCARLHESLGKQEL